MVPVTFSASPGSFLSYGWRKLAPHPRPREVARQYLNQSPETGTPRKLV